jgi:predicted phage-related endonuclease
MERSEAMKFLASRQAHKNKPRKAGLGGGDLAGICGEDEFKSPFQVFGVKIGILEDEVGEAAEWGLRAEEMIRSEYARRHEAVLIRPGFLEDPDNPVFHGHPDDALDDLSEFYDWKFPTEYGSRQFGQREEWDVSDDDSHLIRKKDLIQLHWYAPLLGLPKKAKLVVLPANHRMEEYRVEINPDLVEALRYRAAKFWQDHVLAEEPPDPTASERDNEALQKMYPKEDTSDLIEPDEQQLVTIENYHAALRESWDANKKASAMAHLLKQMIGKRGGFLLPDGLKLTWKTARDSKGIKWEELARSLIVGGEVPADLMKKHIGVTKRGGRRFVSPKRWSNEWKKEDPADG